MARSIRVATDLDGAARLAAGDIHGNDGAIKALAQVERAFRAFNTDLDIRPIRHRTEQRVRAHVFLRMLSYYISWHMQARLAPLLFTDDDKQAVRSPCALAKAADHWGELRPRPRTRRPRLRRRRPATGPMGGDGVFAAFGLSPADIAELRERFITWPRN